MCLPSKKELEELKVAKKISNSKLSEARGEFSHELSLQELLDFFFDGLSLFFAFFNFSRDDMFFFKMYG